MVATRCRRVVGLRDEVCGQRLSTTLTDVRHVLDSPEENFEAAGRRKGQLIGCEETEHPAHVGEDALDRTIQTWP